MKISDKIKLVVFMLLCVTAQVNAQNYLITDYGAKGDGKEDNTVPIQKAIDKATLKGGTVIIPEGVFMTGTIMLKTNVTLQINKNGVIKGLAKKEAYPTVAIKYPVYTGMAQWANTLIYAADAENIAVKGEGTIDGNGGDPIFFFSEKNPDKSVRRPYVFLIVGCKNVSISDITMKNSAMWMQHYLACDFLRIKGVTVFNHVNPNNDGMDIGDCHNVVISDCIIDADDDALCFKSEGARGVKNVVVTNCILSSHASAFKLGTGSVSGFQSIQFSNSVIRPSLATNMIHVFKQKGGLTGIDMASVDGALLKDINIMNISIDSTENPIFIKLGNRLAGGKTKDRTGIAEGIHLSQITVKNAGPVASVITGFPGNYIRDISFRDIFIEHNGSGTVKDTSLTVGEYSDQYPGEKVFRSKLPASGFYIRHVKNIQFNNLQIKLLKDDVRPALVFDDVEGVEITGFKYQTVSAVPAHIIIANSKQADISFSVLDQHTLKQINSTGIFVNHKPTADNEK